MSVLIVDDSMFARMLNKDIVSKILPANQIQEAASGDEAVELMRKEPADIIFMDMNMPGMNGIEASKVILEEYPQTRIAICTANVQDAIRDQATAIGVAFIEKPLAPDAVANFISDVD